MKYSNTIEYNINTKLDSSGLTKLQAQIKQLESSMQQMSNHELLNSDKVQAAKTQLEGLNNALTNSFDSSLGILDLSKFRAELDSSGVSAKGLQSAFNMMGAEGQSALNGLTTQIANFNGGMERTSSQIDKIFTTFSNTFRWGLVSSFFSQFMNAIHSSVDYVKELDDSLTQIMLVTDYNRDSMNEFAKSANEAAKAVSMTTTGMTNASLIFAQQGYNLGQSQELATLSAKLANASQQDTATTSDQITAYMNAYGLQDSMEELTQQMDNWALIANVSAADVGELAKASQRAASMANAVGVSGEALAAQIATIESVTREAPEQIGNGLKTIYARFSDIALGKTDEDGVGLGKVTGTLEKIGVKVLDQFGDIRSMDDIMEDLMVVWDDLDTTTKTAAAQALAGKYQVNRFEALMENSDMYREYKGATGSAATGTLDQMNEKFANSIEGRSARLQASLEGLFSTIFNTDDIYPWMDAAQGAVDLLQKFFDALGGGKTVLLGISSLLAKTFNQNIARSINDTLANRELMQIRQQNIEGVNDTLDRVGIDRTSGIGQYISATAEQAGKGAINDAQYDTYMANVQNWINAQTALTQSEEELQDTINALNMAYGKAVGENNAVFKDENGLNTQFANEERLNLSQDQINKIMSQADFSEAIAGARNFSNELQQVQSIQEKYNNSSENAKQQLEQLYLASDRADAALEQLYNTGVISDDMFNDMKAAIAKVVVDLEESGQATDQTERELNELIATMGRFVKMAEGMDANQLKKILLGGAEEVQKKQTARDFNQAQVNRADENAQKSRQNVSDSQNIKEILDTLNAVQQLTFAWQAFQNLGSLWANEDLTDGEKVLQTIMNLTMAMPQLISAMQTLQDNSFLKNMGNGLLNVLNSSNNVPTLFAQLQSQSDQIATIQNQVVEAQAAMGAPLEEALLQIKLGSDEIMELQRTADIGAQALQTLDNAASGVVDGGLVKLVEEGQKAQKQLDELENTVGKALEEGLIEAPKVLDNSAQALNKVGKESEKTQAQLSQMPNVFVEMYTASLAAGGGITGFKAALDVATTSMLEFLSVSGPFLALGLVIAGIAYAIGQVQEQAKKAKEDALEAFDEAQSKLEQIQSLQEKINSFEESYATFKESKENGKELAAEAEEIAKAMKDAGMETQAAAVHLAAIDAAASGTAEDFAKLAQEIEKAQFEAKALANRDIIETSGEVLHTQQKNMEQVLRDQEQLKDKQQELNNLDPWTPNYAARKTELESLISTLKDTVAGEQEAIDAANAAMNAQGELAGMQADKLNDRLNATDQITALGWENQMGPYLPDDRSLDTESLREIFSQNVQGFGLLDDLEQIDFMLAHVTDEAQAADLQMQQLLRSNENLTDSRMNPMQREGNLIISDAYQSNDYLDIAGEMQRAGFTAQQQLQLIATLDDNATKEDIIEKIHGIQEDIANGDDFNLALKANLDLDSEQMKDMARSQLAAWEPDEGLSKKDKAEASAQFQGIADTFFENEDSLGVEGTPFEDYSEDLLENADALEEVVEGILRYNDAIESLDKNLEDWRDALNDTNELSKKHVDAVIGLQETYSDFLDLSEDMNVSKDFAENTENLKLMEEAAEGVEGKYEELAQAAAKDILIHADVSDLDMATDALDGLKEYLNGEDFANLNIGDAIDFDDTGLRQKINDLATATGWSAQQMVDYLNSIGIQIDPSQFEVIPDAMDEAANEVDAATDAIVESGTITGESTIESDTQTDTDTKDFTDAIPQISNVPWTATIPAFDPGELSGGMSSASGVPVSGFVPKIDYTTNTVPAEETKTTTTTATGSKLEKGGDGTGHVQLKKGAKGNKGSTGKSKNSGGSRPSSGGGGGGGKGKSCFVAGTLISTSLGFKPIEQIQKEDIVLSYNKQLGLNEYSEVLQTMIHDIIEPIYTIYIKDEQLRVTGIHRFFVVDKITCGVPQWICAADLHVGQWVLFADGTWHVIYKIEINVEHQIVYNFEVSGNHNYYVGHNQILAHNKGGGGKGGKGGGGGGGKAKTIENKEKKEHKKDYYEEVNSQLDKTEKILSKIEKEEDRLIGDKARANQNKQLGLLQKEIELNKEKQKIQQKELKDVDELMKKRAKEARELAAKNGIVSIIPSPIYDEDGVIANYEQMSAAIDKIHNEFIDKYNAAAKAGNEDLTKEIQKTMDKFDKQGEDLLKNAQRHNKLQTEIEETTNTLEELKNAIEDIRIEAYKAHQEAQDELKDLKEDAAELASIFRDFNDDGFLTKWSLDENPIEDIVKSMHELDDIYTVTQEDANAFYQDLIDKKKEALKNTTDKDEIAAIESAINYFRGQQSNLSDDTLQNGMLGLAMQDLEQLKGWIDGTNKESNPFGENEAALWEAYQDAYDRALELTKDWRETVQDLRDSIIDAYDDQQDAIEQNIDEYDRLLDHLERIGDTYALYYGEDSYDNILAIMDQQGTTMQQQLNDLTTAFNYWEQRYQEAVATGDEKLIQEIKEKMEDAQDEMYDKAEELAEHWVDRYEKAIDASIQKIDIKLWGGGPGQMDLEDQTMIWELQKDYMDTYKDDVEKAYEVDKLRSKYIGLLNDAQGMSLQTQNKIRAQMQEQLNLLENQGTMSEYDVKLANAKLEILQKQIALEDAQRNKNKMQLRRDTQGNYRYVYTAEQGDVQQAQDELNESQFDAYEMTKEQTIANNDRAVNLYQDYMNKMRDIANKYKDDEVARNEAMKALSEEYGKLLEALGEDFADTTNGMYEVLTWMIENGTQDTSTAAMTMLDQLYDKNGEVKENTGNDWRDFATQITDEVLPNIEDAVEEGLGNIDNEAAKLKENLVGNDGALTKIGSGADDVEDSMQKAAKATKDLADASNELFEAFGADDSKLQEAMNKLSAYEKQLKDTQNSTSLLSTKLKESNAALQSKTAEAEHYKTALDFSTGAKKVGQGSIVKLKKGTLVHYDRYGGIQQDEEGNSGWRLPNDMWVKFGEPVSGVPLPYNFYATGESLKAFGGKKDPQSDSGGGVAKTDYRHHQTWWFDQQELQKNVLDAMDTGGYTGEWNEKTPLWKDGKIAMLHQKELVLNAMDTQNILAAVNLMRDITKGSMMGLSNIGGFGSASSSYNPITEQRVEIQASFPNATDAEDIRTALLELSDKAYQYAHRTI